MRENARDYPHILDTFTISHHRIGFPWTCLPIGENRAVISLENVFDDREGRFSVNFDLTGFFIENFIESEQTVLLAGQIFDL